MVMPSSDSKPRINEEPSEKLGDSSTVWEDDQVESNRPQKEGEEEREEEEEEEDGFCLFMKGGGCKESFTAWEVCVEEAKNKKEDFVTNCMEVSTTLYECMNVHSDYYQLILEAEKVLYGEEEEEEEVEKEEAEKNQVEQDISEEQEVAAARNQG